jgi:hypothetical protein
MTKLKYLFGLLVMAALPLQAADWSAVPTTEIGVFYPGQVSAEDVLYGKHKGARKLRKGELACQDCHEDEYVEQGEILFDERDENPLEGRRTSALLSVQMVVENDQLLTRVSWEKATAAAATNLNTDFDTRLTVMLDDASVTEFGFMGCWASCHTDSDGMLSDSGAGVQKYLPLSRTSMDKTTGGVGIRPQGDLDASLAGGNYLELWQAQLNPGAAASAASGYVLDKRHMSADSTISAVATETDSSWSVVFSSPLAGSAPHKTLEAGKSYTFGFALHDQHAAKRYHLVSHAYRFNLGGAEVVLEPVLLDE